MHGPDIIELHRSLLDDLHSRRVIDFEVGNSTPIAGNIGGAEPADATSKSVVADRAGRPVGVLLVSNRVNPALVGRSAVNAAEAKQILGTDLGSVVLTPLAQGTFRGLSYALWPWQRPLSSFRWLRGVQRKVLLPRVLGWLRHATELTRFQLAKEDLETGFAHALRQMSEDTRFPNQMREAARKGLDRLCSGLWRPLAALGHNDLHWGNVLLPRDRRPWHRQSPDFILIDWAGANTRGYPFYDLLSLCICLREPSRVLRQEVRLHCRILACDPEDAVSYLTASLGALGMNLERFPEHRYVAMATQMFLHLSNALE